jgi:hypothetical protein
MKNGIVLYNQTNKLNVQLTPSVYSNGYAPQAARNVTRTPPEIVARDKEIKHK